MGVTCCRLNNRWLVVAILTLHKTIYVINPVPTLGPGEAFNTVILSKDMVQHLAWLPAPGRLELLTY